MTTRLNALPTEALLDESAWELGYWECPKEIRQWLVSLANERDPDLRANAFFLGARKKLDDPVLIDMFRGMLAAAARNEYEGAAALNAFLSVRASGELLNARVSGFRNLRRMRDRLGRRPVKELARTEQAWLQDVDTLLARIEAEGRAAVQPESSSADVAGAFADLFGTLMAKIGSGEELAPDERELLATVSRLELTALRARASGMAEKVNPLSAAHSRRTLPLLAEIDSDVRNLRDFLDRMDEDGSGRRLREHVTVMSDILETNEEKWLRSILEGTVELQAAWRLLRGLDRNPMPQRTLAWFVDRIVVAGHILTTERVRSRPLDVVGATMCVLEHYDQGRVRIPASARVLELLREKGLEHVDLAGDSLVMDRENARRVPLPHGMSLPRLPFMNVEKFADRPVEEISVKELVLDNINNTSVLLGLLKNQKVVNTPGVVALVAQRARNMRVLETICTTRSLHSGYANKDVPLAILRSPMNIPIKTLRRFVSVRYVSKIELKRLEVDRSAVRREVADEIRAYLKTLA